MRPLQVGELSRKEKALSFEFTAGSVKEQTVYRRILMETKRNAETRRRRADWIARLFLSRCGCWFVAATAGQLPTVDVFH